jgi:hypothetical protein
MTDAFPLHWPVGWPRTPRPQRARFDTNFSAARDGLLDELRRLKASQIVISSNLELRRDGLPKAQRRQPDDCGVAVYFLLNGHPQCIPSDKWNCIEDNLQAVRLTVAALRGLERWGAKEMVTAAFRGFAALPEGGNRSWWEVLGVGMNAQEADIRAAFVRLARIAHPDAGGSHEAFVELQKAYEDALKSV